MDDLKVLLKEERIPDGWESRVRDPFGLTFAKFNLTVFRIELDIDENYNAPSVGARTPAKGDRKED